MAPKKMIDYDKSFRAGLDEARYKLDLNTTVGQNIDNLLTPLFRKYGFIDNNLVCINPSKIADKDRPFKHSQSPNVVLAELGCDMKWFEEARKQQDLPIGHQHELSELTTLFLKAQGVIQKLIKELHFNTHNTALNAFDLYSPLHWVSKFAVALDKLKNENKDLHMTEETKIVEALQKLIYHKPKKVIDNINEVAKEFNSDVYTIKVIFEKHVGVSIREYSDLVINEGLGDYVKHAAANAGNKFLGKFGVGQAKVSAKAKVATAQDMNNVLNKWTEITHGDGKAATPDALKNFLVKDLAMDPTVVDASLAKFKDQFVGGNKNSTASSLGAIKARNQAQPQLTTPSPAPVAQPTPAPVAPVAPAAAPVAPATPTVPTTPAKVKITPAQAKAQARKELGNFNPGVDKRAEEILNASNNESVKKTGKTLKEMSNAFNIKNQIQEPINEDYLPKNVLRDFFLDALKTQKMSVLGTHVAPATQAPTTQATPQTVPASTAPITPTVQAPQAATPAPVGKPTPANFAKQLAALPANDRAAAISQALATLTDDEAKAIVNQLLTPKSGKKTNP